MNRILNACLAGAAAAAAFASTAQAQLQRSSPSDTCWIEVDNISGRQSLSAHVVGGLSGSYRLTTRMQERTDFVDAEYSGPVRGTPAAASELVRLQLAAPRFRLAPGMQGVGADYDRRGLQRASIRSERPIGPMHMRVVANLHVFDDRGRLACRSQLRTMLEPQG